MNKKLQDLSTLLKIKLFKKRDLLETLKKELLHIETQIQYLQEQIAQFSEARHKRFLSRSYTCAYDKYLEHLQREQTSLYKQRMALNAQLHNSYIDIQKHIDRIKIIEKIRINKYPLKSANN
ncbi:hypothetical protein [Chlamydia suis]|uniref:hypothetical protein n=1 Tax=Chlamydia suis TaxID=83559 RepID=UPI0009B0C533|nr:hypothetical protein [Chlamydia suis]